MSVNELYQQMIIDHSKNPRNYGRLDNFTHTSQGNNPLCGDKIDVSLIVQDNVIKDLKWEGTGCAISQASASLMSTLVKGKSVDEFKEMFTKFRELMTIKGYEAEQLGKLKVFSGVQGFPSRVKCASIAWHAINNSLANKETVAK